LAFFKGIMFWEASFWTMPDIFELSKIHGWNELDWEPHPPLYLLHMSSKL
jgi:hypothetical protein